MHSTTFTYRRTRAFTLVEILIVVVILGILAAVVVPQFSSATQEARQGNLKTQLQILNSQIAIYAARSGNAYPDFAADGWGSQANISTMIGGSYLKAPPVNPAWTTSNPGPTSIAVTGDATIRGSAAAAWVWNTSTKTLYASYFNEDTGLMTTNAAD
jgi:general secretion pathway protein G